MPRINSSTVTGFPGLDEHARALGFPRAFRNRHRLSGLNALLLQRRERQVCGHQLGERGRFDALVGVLRGERLPAVIVEQQKRARGNRGRRNQRTR
jgi:hypothetical protein